MEPDAQRTGGVAARWRGEWSQVHRKEGECQPGGVRTEPGAQRRVEDAARWRVGQSKVHREEGGCSQVEGRMEPSTQRIGGIAVTWRGRCSQMEPGAQRRSEVSV